MAITTLLFRRLLSLYCRFARLFERCFLPAVSISFRRHALSLRHFRRYGYR